MGSTTHHQCLGLVDRFCNAMAANKIRYSHFKSNAHLDAAVSGDTDLDLLVDPARREEFHTVVTDIGLKRFDTKFAGKFDDVADYLGWDSDSCKLIHVHVHFKMILGEKRLKSFVMPWTEEIFDNSQSSDQFPIQITNPEMELLLLHVRYALKIGVADVIRNITGKSYYSGDLKTEREYLLARLDRKKFSELVDALIGPASQQLMKVEEDPCFRTYWQLRSQLRREMQSARWISGPSAFFLQMYKTLFWVLAALNKRYFKFPLALRRTPESRGLSIVFVGADGAGKSTQLRKVAKALKWKLDVFQEYMGSGDGSSSLVRLPLLILYRLLIKPKRLQAKSSGETKPKKPSLLKALWATVLAFEKSGKLKRIQRARDRKMIVLIDRFPQIETPGFNDGPLMAGWMDEPGWKRSLAQWEFRQYEKGKKFPPDIALRLEVPPEVAIQRKPEMDVQENERRREAVRAIKFGEGAEVVVVDTGASEQDSYRQIMNAIWKAI